VRDLKKDLGVCKDAARGPWNLNEDLVVSDANNLVVVECDSTLDAIFISESREGWPEAINRAIAAEAEVKRLNLEVVKLSLHRTEDIKLMEETLEVHKLSIATITKLRKALALAHSMILGGEQHTEQSRQVIESSLGLR